MSQAAARIVFRGTKEMMARLRRLADQYPDRVGAALYMEGQIEMTEAKRRTPVDVNYAGGRIPPHPGQLRNSGTVHKPERQGKNISVTLSFGGAAKEYAIHVHENPDALHPIGQWKFLESTLNESRPFMAARVATRLHFNRMKA